MLEGAAYKVKQHHLDREACLYVRQSSLKQVARNTESARRQYALRRHAVALGWSEDRIRVIDEDQGRSGASAANRSGFRDLMARIAAGEVGIVLCLEISRLSRSNCDMARLLQLARITDTLILDEGGVHDPLVSSDKLLLDLKGSLSEYELSGILARLYGGQCSKASRGELRITLPLGLVYDEEGQVAFDPDREVLAALRLVFATFRDKGSAMQAVKWFRAEGVLLPSRPRTGPERGVVRWSLPDHAKVRRILKNPSYAGAYAWGRMRKIRQPDGSARYKTQPPEQWHVLIPEHHEGFISWDEYLRNQETLARNAKAFLAAPARQTAPRKGAALLQGLALCGHCGQRMRVRYTNARPARNEPARVHYVCAEPALRHGLKLCQSIRAEGVDAAVARFAVESMNRESVDLALAVQEQVRADFEAADALRAKRIERLAYKADLARRRYYAADPAHRLVAAKLEADWNDRLRSLEEAERERERRRQARDEELDAEQVRRVKRLADDFAQVWDAPATGNADRKRLLRHLVEDVTLTRDSYEAAVALRLRGGKAVVLDPVPLNPPRQVSHPLCAETVAALDAALETCTDSEAAEVLNQAGYRLWNGDPYTVRHVYRLRARVGMKGHLQRRHERLRERGYLTVSEMARHLNVSDTTVRKRAAQGELLCKSVRRGKRRSLMCKLPPGEDG